MIQMWLNIRISLSSIFVLFGIALALPGAALAQEVILKVHHLLPPLSTAHAKFIVPWCEKLAADSGGKLKCQIFPSMQLGGSAAQLYDQARDGVADIVWTLPGYTAGRFPRVEVFELPFTMNNAEASSRALWEYVQQYDADEFKDVHLLAVHTHGPGYLHMRQKQIRTLADLRGVKIRAGTRTTNQMLAAFGATPVGMPVTQLPQALSSGVIDGALIPWEVVPSVKVQELTKFHTETDPLFPALYTQVFVFAMNKAKYASLPPDLRKILDANSGVELSAWVGRVLSEADAPARKLAEQHGNQFYTIPAEELVKWRDASQSITDAWVKDRNAKGDDGMKLLEAARALIAKYAK
jgi:TRAP-type C4-dicarboxylate transport system substrate-binding protein